MGVSSTLLRKHYVGVFTVVQFVFLLSHDLCLTHPLASVQTLNHLVNSHELYTNPQRRG